MLTETDLTLPGGAVLHVYDMGAGDALTVIWHHGTPNIGAPPEPLFSASERLGIRWVSYDRPGYGGSTGVPGRNIASAATYTAAVTDALGIQRFAVMGHSGGGPHALSCAALLPERVTGAVSIAGLAPYGADHLDWFAGMTSDAALRAAVQGREAKKRFEHSDPAFNPEVFTPADYAALEGEWAWLNRVVEPAQAAGPAPLIDDDLAYVAPWGFDPALIQVPTLLLHGAQDRMVPASHSQWLSHHIPNAELWLRPDDGHLSILNAAQAALEWLLRPPAEIRPPG